MPITEASFSGTVRVILVLIALWLLLRMILRWRKGPAPGRPGTPRPKGDVRIEQVPGGNDSRSRGGDIIDADFEEIKE